MHKHIIAYPLPPPNLYGSPRLLPLRDSRESREINFAERVGAFHYRAYSRGTGEREAATRIREPPARKLYPPPPPVPFSLLDYLVHRRLPRSPDSPRSIPSPSASPTAAELIEKLWNAAVLRNSSRNRENSRSKGTRDGYSSSILIRN